LFGVPSGEVGFVTNALGFRQMWVEKHRGQRASRMDVIAVWVSGAGKNSSGVS